MVKTDLPTLYLIAHIYTHTDTKNDHKSMYTHAHFYHPFSSAVVRDLDHTQTNRLLLQGKNAPASLSLSLRLTHILTDTDTCSLACSHGYVQTLVRTHTYIHTRTHTDL